RHEALLRAAAASLSYALETQRGKLPHVKSFLRYDPGAYMHIGNIALKSLEVFDSQSSEHDRSLFKLLNETRTAPGRRLLKAWLRHPLLDEKLIQKRLDAVECLFQDSQLRNELRKALYKIQDLERLSARLAMGTVGARELIALARSLSLLPEIKILLASSRQDILQNLAERLNPLQGIQEHIDTALLPDPPIKITEGGLVKEGFDPELDELREAAEGGRNWIAELEAREREKSGINSLKVGYNQVFGYYFEVTRPYYHLVPEDYRAIQTLKDRQRYTRSDLRDKEKAILEAEDRSKKREYLLFDGLRAELSPFAEEVRDVSAVLAELDVLASLADIASKRQYCRPEFSQEMQLDITSGRHPVVEAYHDFIPNDLNMSDRARLIILTGPNMSGKSTYLRQTALIALLAQIGSFVPAEKAILPIFERIYTRIGANDDIAGGRSTFMVEMDELAQILQHASRRSLILLDEIGRGTSTYDGLSLAWSLCEYLHDKVGAFSLFATHYFEVTALVRDFPAMRNYHVAAKEEAGGLTFYHQVLAGPASKSYGLEVAKLAGLPAELLEKAKSVMVRLEAQRESKAESVLEELLSQDLNRLSPLEALSLLHRLQANLYQLSSS
ncbi:MAG: DNA mismatch repair protein MutS, partial [Deinococcales bacterium]